MIVGESDATLGNTAKQVKPGWQNNQAQDSFLVKVIILELREIENLIPTSLIRAALLNLKTIGKSTQDNLSQLEQWEGSFLEEWRKFIDLKKGLCGYDVLHWDETTPDTKKCWLTFSQRVTLQFKKQCKNGILCHNRKECQCILFKGFGDYLLKDIVDYFDENTPHKLSESFDFQEDDFQTKLLAEIFAWSCALDRIRA